MLALFLVLASFLQANPATAENRARSVSNGSAHGKIGHLTFPFKYLSFYLTDCYNWDKPTTFRLDADLVPPMGGWRDGWWVKKWLEICKEKQKDS